MIAKRLDSLDVQLPSVPANPDAPRQQTFMKREVDNGVRAEDFIQAAIWCNDPLIRATISRIESRTNDPTIQEVIEESRNPAHQARPEGPTT